MWTVSSASICINIRLYRCGPHTKKITNINWSMYLWCDITRSKASSTSGQDKVKLFLITPVH